MNHAGLRSADQSATLKNAITSMRGITAWRNILSHSASDAVSKSIKFMFFVAPVKLFSEPRIVNTIGSHAKLDPFRRMRHRRGNGL